MTYLALLILLYLNHLYIIGIHAAFKVDFLDDNHPQLGVDEDSKMILWKVKVWAVTKFGWFYSKPIATCPTCMSSLHSLYVYWPVCLLLGFELWMLPGYVLYVGALAGLNEKGT
jgi:hypothetical protein